MAYSSVTYTATSGSPTWSIPFELIDGDWLYMTVDGISVTTFTVDVGALTATWTGSALSGGETVFIYRDTSVATADEPVSYQPGPLSDVDLDLDQKRRRATEQELTDTVVGMDDHVASTTVHVPSGGLTGQFLNKASGATGDSQWVTGVQISVPDPADGGLITWNTTGDVTFLVAGTSGKFLRTNGAGVEPTWETVTGSGIGDVIGPATNLNTRVAIFDGVDSNVLKEDALIKVPSSGLLEAQTLRGSNAAGGPGSACVALSTDATTVLTTGAANPNTAPGITGFAGAVYFQSDDTSPSNSRIWHNRSGSTTWTEIGSGSSTPVPTFAYTYGGPLSFTLTGSTQYPPIDTDNTWDSGSWKYEELSGGTNRAVEYLDSGPTNCRFTVELVVQTTGGATVASDVILEPEVNSVAVAGAYSRVGSGPVTGGADPFVTVSSTFVAPISNGQRIRLGVKISDPTNGPAKVVYARINIKELLT